MAELLFPIAAVLGTFFLLIPALTLLSRSILRWRRRRLLHWPHFADASSFALLLAPTLLPVFWLTSSALHQSEPGRTRGVCLIEHSQATTCVDSAILLLLLSFGMLLSFGYRAWRDRPRFPLHRVDEPSQQQKLQRVVHNACPDPASPRFRRGLRRLRDYPIVLLDHAPEPLFTFGTLRPRIFIDAAFCRSIDEQVLHAALLHELAHLQGRDTFRHQLARLCLSINPVGHWLEHELAHWRAAREADCDARAVQQGGDPLALAEGIVRAARHQNQPIPAAATLCGWHRASLKLRLALLTQTPGQGCVTRPASPGPLLRLSEEYSPPAVSKSEPRQTPSLSQRLPTLNLERLAALQFGQLPLLLALAVAVIAPHVPGLDLLEHFHFEVERLFSLLG
ncbi:MAG: M56 family metallopeptidase [Myxococcota bacterium]|jgi:Zn-dependent protease with chaperone function|nr:M56 family metallopeptidase [Myxococcota bacterium]